MESILKLAQERKQQGTTLDAMPVKDFAKALKFDTIVNFTKADINSPRRVVAFFRNTKTNEELGITLSESVSNAVKNQLIVSNHIWSYQIAELTATDGQKYLSITNPQRDRSKLGGATAQQAVAVDFGAREQEITMEDVLVVSN